LGPQGVIFGVIDRTPLTDNPFVNLYEYAGNNPVNFVDPDGRQAITPGKVQSFAQCFAACSVFEEIPPVEIACEKKCEEGNPDPQSCNITNTKVGDKCNTCQECPGQDTPICEEVQCQCLTEKK